MHKQCFTITKTANNCSKLHTKAQIHDCTLYENNDEGVHLYMWHESDDEMSADEFIT